MEEVKKIQISLSRINSVNENNYANASSIVNIGSSDNDSELEKKDNDKSGYSAGDLEKQSSLVKEPVGKEEEEPHCVFSKSKKMMICLIVSYAGLVSPFSGTIYYPALTQISQDFNVSVSLVNLTVTVYMIFQALSPSFWGPLSDLVGRRPVYIGTLTVLVGICIGLAKAPSYTALIVLRMFHAFGASSTIALGAGVISDFSTPAERGGYFSIFGSCQMISTTVGPVLGGVLSEELTWRWVFWILLIMGAVGLILVFFFVPETLRSLVGNGSGYANPTPSQWIKRRIANKKTGPQPSAPTTSKGPRKFPNFLEPFIFLRYPDVIIGMAINGCFTAVMYCFMTTTPTYFSSIYGLNELQVGLCYLPFGVGCFVGSSVSGRLLNKDFRTIALKQGITPDEIKKSGKLALDFPIYRARLRSCWISMILGELVTIVYGWTLCAETHLAVPIILQFLGGISSTPIFNCIQTLMADLFPGRGATITASANLVRCIFGAIATSTIQPGIDSVGLGWMFTIIGLILTITICLVPVLIKCGPRWRKNRVEQHQHREARKQRNNENNSSNPQTATTIEQ